MTNRQVVVFLAVLVAILLLMKFISPQPKDLEDRSDYQSEYERIGCKSPRDSVACMEAWDLQRRQEEHVRALQDEGFLD